MKISRIRTIPLLSLAAILLQLAVYLYSVDQASDVDFLVILAVNGAISYLSLILVAVGNVAPGGLFGRLQEFFWKTCLVSFYSLLGLCFIPFSLIILTMLDGPRDCWK